MNVMFSGGAMDDHAYAFVRSRLKRKRRKTVCHADFKRVCLVDDVEEHA